MTVEDLKQQIDEITVELKSMSGNEPSYAGLWDRRADLLAELKGLEKDKITMTDIVEYQVKKDQLVTIGEFKELGRELRDKFNLTDRQAIDILNKDHDAIAKILVEAEL